MCVDIICGRRIAQFPFDSPLEEDYSLRISFVYIIIYTIDIDCIYYYIYTIDIDFRTFAKMSRAHKKGREHSLKRIKRTIECMKACDGF